MSQSEAADFLMTYRVGLIFYGPEERRMDRESTLEARLESLGWVRWSASDDEEIIVFRHAGPGSETKLPFGAITLPPPAASVKEYSLGYQWK